MIIKPDPKRRLRLAQERRVARALARKPPVPGKVDPAETARIVAQMKREALAFRLRHVACTETQGRRILGRVCQAPRVTPSNWPQPIL
jgi:hypothetical protein